MDDVVTLTTTRDTLSILRVSILYSIVTLIEGDEDPLAEKYRAILQELDEVLKVTT